MIARQRRVDSRPGAELTSFRCRSCQAPGARLIVSLGETPLANALLTADHLSRPEAAFPLDLVFCPNCSLVQITETVSPDVLFRDYPYFSSVSDTVVRNAADIVDRMIDARGLTSKSLVVEIASNDGYLLQRYVRAGIRVKGIEPAGNIARVARERGIATIEAFFGGVLADELHGAGVAADVIHANNVLAHVPDLNGFVAGIGRLLTEHGVAIIEVPYLRDLIDHGEFDTIYHEHLCYFSVTALDALFARHDLVITEVERIPIHGGSLRLFVEPRPHPRRASVQRLLDEESEWGVAAWPRYQAFEQRVRTTRQQLVGLLDQLKRHGERIAAYGAAAKGCTLLNTCGIGSETLDFVVDRSVHKQGRYLPGSRLPVYAPEHLLESMPGYLLLLSWNFADEIMAQQREYQARGGTFVIPIPTPVIAAP